MTISLSLSLPIEVLSGPSGYSRGVDPPPQLVSSLRVGFRQHLPDARHVLWTQRAAGQHGLDSAPGLVARGARDAHLFGEGGGLGYLLWQVDDRDQHWGGDGR